MHSEADAQQFGLRKNVRSLLATHFRSNTYTYKMELALLASEHYLY